MPNTKRELFHLKQFLPSIFDGVEYTFLPPTNPPMPDVLIQAKGKTIGTELTELNLDNDGRKWESTQEVVMHEAQKLFERDRKTPLCISVSFIKAVNWQKLPRQETAGYIVDAVNKHVSQVEDLPQYQDKFIIRVNRLNSVYIQSINIAYSSSIRNPCWAPSAGFVVPELSAETLQNIISRKNKNISGYLTGCNEVWLLIIEAGSPSTYFDGFEKLQKITFSSEFTRTLIGRIPTGDLLQLTTKPQF